MRGQWRLFLGEQEGYQGIYFRVGEEDGLHGGFHKFAVVIGFYAIIGGSHVVGAGFNDGLTDVLLGSVAGDAVGGPGAHVSLVGAEDALGSALDGVAGEAASTAGKQRASGGDQVV